MISWSHHLCCGIAMCEIIMEDVGPTPQLEDLLVGGKWQWPCWMPAMLHFIIISQSVRWGWPLVRWYKMHTLEFCFSFFCKSLSWISGHGTKKENLCSGWSNWRTIKLNCFLFLCNPEKVETKKRRKTIRTSFPFPSLVVVRLLNSKFSIVTLKKRKKKT